MGSKLVIDELIGNKKEDRTAYDLENDEDNEVMENLEQQLKLYDSLDTVTDFKTMGLVELDPKAAQYFPSNKPGISFSSKSYHPLGTLNKAPNISLEMNTKRHESELA